MQPNEPDDDKKTGDLPAFSPLPPPVNDDTDEPAAEAASEPGDTHPVFGSNVQPQEILDENIVGTPEPTLPTKGEPNVVNFDPENDPRTRIPDQDPPQTA